MSTEREPSSAGLTYKDAGVDIDAATRGLRRARASIEATQGDGCVGGVGGFGGLFRMPEGLEDPLLCASTDGVGTKIHVACMTGRHDTVGEDLVNHCVNDILVQGARPLFVLDYAAFGKIDEDTLVAVIEGFARGCANNGCALLGGETAEMPGTYKAEDYDLAATVVGVVERRDLLPRPGVAPGDVLIGLRSNGLHTNGYSLARKALFEKAGLGPGDQPPELGGESIGDALLAVHRTYAPLLLPLLPAGRIKALAHITGGGFTDNIPRVLPAGTGATVDTTAWNPLPIFDLIGDAGDVPRAERYRAFNMGVGMVLVVASEDADTVLSDLEAAGETGAVRMGEVTGGDGTVTLRFAD
jgi:phosphoribosylformylglycinamidine cyclo-ligase